MQRKFIATTTINNDPEKTSYAFFTKNHPDWILVIAGDEKTDNKVYEDFEKNNKNVIYLSLEKQEEMNKELSEVLGYNTDARKTFSIYYSFLQGADVIALVDDDNYPLRKWGKFLKLQQKEHYFCYKPSKFNIDVIDPLSIAKYTPYVWHRGFPLSLVRFRKRVKKDNKIAISPLVQADFWYGEPDVDALCRLFTITDDFFAVNVNYKVFPFTAFKYSPFNAQNVFLSRSIVPYYFLFSSLGRMSDIWMSYYLEALFDEPIVIYDKPSVFQKRNPHNLKADFELETLGYFNTEQFLMDINKDPDNFFNYLRLDEVDFYKKYVKELKSKL